MGIQITAFNDSETKPTYLESAPNAADVVLEDGELAVFVGDTAGVQLEQTNGILRCLQALRERDWSNPATSAFNVAKFNPITGVLEVTLSAALPVFTENDVAVMQGADFTKSANSNTGHVRRMNEKWREINTGATLRGSVVFEVFKADEDGTVDYTVSLGTGPVAEGRVGALLCPSASGDFVSQPDTGPAEYRYANEDWVYVGIGQENSALHSDQFDDVFWETSPTVNIDQDQPGLDGTPNTAWTVTDTNPDAVGSVRIPFESGNFSTTGIMGVRAFVAKDTDTSRVVRIQVSHVALPFLIVSMDMDTTTGEFSLIDTLGDTPTKEAQVIDHGNFYEMIVVVDGSTPGVEWYGPWYQPAHPSLGSGGFTTGSSVLAVLEQYDGASLAEIAGMPVNIAAATAVTQPSTAISFPIANHDNSSGIYVAEMVYMSDLSVPEQNQLTGILDVDGTADTGDVMSYNGGATDQAAQLVAEDATDLVTTGGSNFLGGQRLHPLSAYSAPNDTQGVTLGQTVPTSGQYAGFTVAADILLGPGHFKGSFRPFLIRNIQRWTSETVG